jgi:hypothetical protein
MYILVETILILAMAPFGGQVRAKNGSEIYVDRSATSGDNNGSSWHHAFLDLQYGLAEARSAPDDINTFVAGEHIAPLTQKIIGT